MDYKTIQLAYDGAVATITLNRPEKRNAISFELIDDLLRALDEVAEVGCDRADPDRSGQGVLLGDGSGQSEGAAGPFAGTEPAGFADDGPVVPLAV